MSFIILGSLVCLLALLTIFARSPVTGSMLLVLMMCLLAGMFALLKADFAAVAQVIVYAGAIMVVFVFVIMLLNIPVFKLFYERPKVSEIILGLLLIVTVTIPLLFLKIQHLKPVLTEAVLRPPYYPIAQGENVKNISALMFTDYLWAFEVISLVIIVAIVGAVMIAKKEKQIS